LILQPLLLPLVQPALLLSRLRLEPRQWALVRQAFLQPESLFSLQPPLLFSAFLFLGPLGLSQVGADQVQLR